MLKELGISKMSLKERIIKAYQDGVDVADMESNATSYSSQYVSMIDSVQISQRCLASEYSAAVVREQTMANQVRELSRGFLERTAFNLGYFFNRYE